jgi:predicted ArsR family transcriptional regulator
LGKGGNVQATRQDILDFLRARGHATVREIGDALRLTATGIRQHLTVLERDGLVSSAEERGHVGRPALVYRLTPAGDELYPKRYDELANALIEEARQILAPPAFQALIKGVASRFSDGVRPRLGHHRALGDRVAEVERILGERGDVVTREEEPDGYLIRKQTCPWWNVATRNSIVCALDVEFIRQMCGADARLTTSLLRGDDCCTFRVRREQRATGASR